MKLIIAILLFVLIFSKNAFAALKLNEIYPAPPSGENEWVEIYNDENSAIDLSQYSLSDLTNKKIKFINTILPPLGFEIATSSGVLNNDGDTVFLKNNLGEIIEIATYSTSFDSTKTYAKCPNGNGNWFMLNMPTKNTSNETACQILMPTPTLTITPTIAPTIGTENPTPTSPAVVLTEVGSISYENIYISETMVDPPTGEKEWLEIYNDNDFPVSLNNWFVDDLENAGSSPKIFSLEINAKGYGVFDLTSSMFNNNGDSIRLLDFNKNLKDDFEYSKTEQGKTLGRNRLDSDDFCLQEPSKNSVNNPCINPTPSVTPILFVTMGRINPSPTKNVLQTKTPINMGLINQTPTLPRRSPIFDGTEAGLTSPDILGISTKINHNNSLINLLTILSTSYSLLTICSILFKMKLSYGKNKNFYSPSLHSS